MNKLKVSGGSLIVAGTSIGAGMLGLPVVSGPAGFLPSFLILVACWAFMCTTGLLYAELACAYKEETNILTMARKTLGPIGKPITLVIYLFMFYSLSIAYFVGGANILGTWFPGMLPEWIAPKARILIFALIFIPVVQLGRRIVDPTNRFLMWALIAAYIGFVFVGFSSIDTSNLVLQNWDAALLALPVAFTSFGYQGTIPTLASWMHYDKKSIQKAIVYGTLITLAIYTVWMALILGIVPYEGEFGLKESLREGYNAVVPLQYFTKNSAVVILGTFFGFTAIATSFLGVGIGLVDFFKDAFSIDRSTTIGKCLLPILSFLPPLLFSLSHPHLFLEALGYAGGFGSALLLGALPIVMLYFAKYRHGADIESSWIIKKETLLVLLAFVIFEIGCEIIHLIGVN